MSISPARTLPILLLLVSALAAADETSTKSASTEELMQLEQLWNDAHLKGDADTLERLWSDDLQVIVPKMPLMRKADVLAFARSGRMKFDKYSTSEVQVRFYGDAAVVTGRMTRSRTVNAQSVDDNWQFTKVYLHKAGGWRVVIFQASDAPLT